MQYTRPVWAARILFHPLSRIIFSSGTRSPAPHHATTTTSGSSHKTACAERCAPDVVVVAWCGAGERVPLEKIIRDRGWNKMRAAQTGRVYCIRDEFLNTPAPTLIYGLKALEAALHPELFPQPDGLRCIAACAKSSNEAQPL